MTSAADRVMNGFTMEGRAMRKLIVAMGLAGVMAAAGGVDAQAQTVLKMASWLPPSHPIMKDMMGPWAEDVKRVTGGKVTVEILPSPLGPPPAHFDIAANGVADITYSVHGYTPGRFALTKLAELPFLGDSSKKVSVAYWRLHREMLAKADEHKGVQVLSIFVHGPGHIFNSRKPIAKLADLEGMKMRTGGGVVNEITKTLGIVNIAAPSTQAYEILSTKVADGILFPHESVPFFKLQGVLKYGTLVPGGLYNSSFFLVMNPAKWAAIPAEQQQAIMGVSGEAFAARAGAAWDAADAAGLAAMRAAGIQFATLDDDAMSALRQRVAPVQEAVLKDAAAKGVDGARALAFLKAAILAQ